MKTLALLSASIMSAMVYAGITDQTGVAADAFSARNGVSFYTDSYVSFEFQGSGPESTRNLREWQTFAFSMYTLDAAGKILQTFTADSMHAGTFAQLMRSGVDKVGFAVSNGSETIHSTPVSSDRIYVTTEIADDILYIGFFVKGFGGKPMAQADLIYAISIEGAAPPAGQPLPGVLASILIGAGVFRLRRRRPFQGQ